MSLPLTSEDLQKQLYVAAAAGDCTAIRMLAMHGADLDARNEEGFTAFNLATMNNHPQAAMTILAAREYNYFKKLGTDPKDITAPANSSKERGTRAA